MCIVGLVFSRWVDFFGEGVEWSRVEFKVIHIKHGLWIRNLVSLQVVVEPCPRCSENNSDELKITKLCTCYAPSD